MKNKFAWVGRKLPLILSMMLFLGGRLSAQSGGSSTLPCTPSSPVTMACPATIDPFGGPIALTGGLPAGGVYSGSGVANGFLDLAKKPIYDPNQIVYTYTDATGCIGRDTCKYVVPCDPKVFMNAKKDVCLGDTIELFINADALTEYCQYESYLFSSTFGTLTLVDYSGDESIEPLQVYSVRTVSGVTMLRSRLMGTFYPKAGTLVKVRLLAPAAGDYTIALNGFQFSGTRYPVDPITIHVADRPTVTIKDSAVCANAGYTIKTTVSDNVTAYEWSSGSTESAITVTAAASYSVKVRSDKGCTASDTATISFVTIGCDELPNNPTTRVFQSGSYLHISPVPANAELRVEAAFNIRNLSVTDAQGRAVDARATVNGSNAVVDLSQLSQGVYQLQVFGTNGEVAQESFTKL